MRRQGAEQGAVRRKGLASPVAGGVGPRWQRLGQCRLRSAGENRVRHSVARIAKQPQ